ncbi:MAG TPA: hypothetical protein VF167_02460 [Longimicrobiaceae bacterium]
MKPPTLAEATERNLLTQTDHAGIHTFSNGSEWDIWADRNCHRCRFWTADVYHEDDCALPDAGFLGMVTPELARVFGWGRDPDVAAKYGERSAWSYPDDCPWRQLRDDRDDGTDPPPPEPDPHQLVLLADPTEDAALIQQAPVPQEVAV